MAAAGSILLLKKGYTDLPALFVPYVSSFNYENLIVDNGSVSEDSSSASKHVLFHSVINNEGIFWHGPYAALSFGLYKATFAVKVDNVLNGSQSDHLLTLDVRAKSGSLLLAEKYVYGKNVPPNKGWFNVTVVFGLMAPAVGVEFRGFVIGNCSAYLDYVAVAQLIPQPVTELAFNSDNLHAVKGTLSDGVIVHVTGSGTCWYGPRVSLPKGDYTAKFWLKVNRPYNGTLLYVDVSINLGEKVLTSLAVSGLNFTRVDTWQSFEVKFTLQSDSNNVEFRGMNVAEFAPVSLLLVEVYPDTGR
jgi:hypothetical protein